jgi:hypothetical protein
MPQAVVIDAGVAQAQYLKGLKATDMSQAFVRDCRAIRVQFNQARKL